MNPLVVLALSLLGISMAAPLVRLSHADPLAIAVWRLGISMAVIGAIVGASGSWRQWRRLRRGDLALALGAGVMLALHFWAWNASIGLTTISASVVLVNVQPVIVAAASALWLHEPPTRGQWGGIAVAVAGATVVGLADAGASAAAAGAPPHALLGDALALSGAVTASVYYLAGRRLRRTLDLWPYVALVYGACFVVLLAFAGAARTPLAPQPPREIGIFAALALGPMLLGHTGMNWALRYLPAYVVNLTVLGEPVGATVLAAALPGIHEIPPPMTLAGGALLLAGILITLSRAPRAEAVPAVPDAA
ncbi:MAG TPA: DMT family transporter [Gemmatimonadaceae bacterium]|nr:DMT family transporter [Gemmatimonadaceae bacterium]